ncbi:DUF2953 domain-containing protein [Terrilactibacillus sp. S3-3]|nr:DUF2953 domain-containing protein [Terrilactibacillus sp. S3-3]
MKWHLLLKRFLFDAESIIQANQKILTVFHFWNLRWRTDLGLGEAKETAIGCGLIWALKAAFLKLIQKKTNHRRTANPSCPFFSNISAADRVVLHDLI